MSETSIDPGQATEQAARVVGELSREADEPAAVDIDPDRTRETTRTGLSRMRTDWRAGDAAEVQGIIEQARGLLHRSYPDIYQLLNEVWLLVRQPVLDDHEQYVRDVFGWPTWKTMPSGAYIEDYSNLTDREKDDFLLRITTGLIEWEQRAEDRWLEAMLAKARWEETMATGFTAPTGRVTVEERTQRGRTYAAEDRYHAIFRAAVSRQADQLVRSMELLGQRLKDSLAS